MAHSLFVWCSRVHARGWVLGGVFVLAGCIQPKESAEFDYAHSPFARRDAAVGAGDGGGADDGGDDAVDEGDGGGDPPPVRDAGASAQPQSDAGSSAGPKPAALHFDVLTVALGGRYQPRNIGAI